MPSVYAWLAQLRLKFKMKNPFTSWAGHFTSSKRLFGTNFACLRRYGMREKLESSFWGYCRPSVSHFSTGKNYSLGFGTIISTTKVNTLNHYTTNIHTIEWGIYIRHMWVSYKSTRTLSIGSTRTLCKGPFLVISWSYSTVTWKCVLTGIWICMHHINSHQSWFVDIQTLIF